MSCLRRDGRRVGAQLLHAPDRRSCGRCACSEAATRLSPWAMLSSRIVSGQVGFQARALPQNRSGQTTNEDEPPQLSIQPWATDASAVCSWFGLPQCFLGRNACQAPSLDHAALMSLPLGARAGYRPNE